MDTLLMDGLAQTTEQQSAADPWRGFAPGVWRRSVDVRDFIQRNLCPYEGDPGFVAGPPPRTTALFQNMANRLAGRGEVKKPKRSLLEPLLKKLKGRSGRGSAPHRKAS